MNAEAIKWNDEYVWVNVQHLNLKSVERGFMSFPDNWFPLQVRYDNGQLCTFRRIHKQETER